MLGMAAVALPPARRLSSRGAAASVFGSAAAEFVAGRARGLWPGRLARGGRKLFA